MSDISFRMDYALGILKLWVDDQNYVTPPLDLYGRSAWWKDAVAWFLHYGPYLDMVQVNEAIFRALKNWINLCVVKNKIFELLPVSYPFIYESTIQRITPSAKIACISDCTINAIEGGEIIDIVGCNIDSIAGNTRICNIYGKKTNIASIKDCAIIENIAGANISNIYDYTKIKTIINCNILKIKDYSSIWIAEGTSINCVTDHAKIKESFGCNITKVKKNAKVASASMD